MPKKTGVKCKLYIDDTGGVGDGSWVEIGLVTDTVEITQTKEEVEASDRSSDHNQYLSGQKEDGVEATLIDDPTHPGVIRLKAAYAADQYVGVAAADGDIAVSGTIAFQMDCEVLELSRSEPLKDKVTRSLNLKRSANSAFVPGESTTA